MRIVSLVPSTTESVCELGAGAQLVGRTRYCTEPATVAGVASIGGTKNPDLERIVQLEPDLVLANAEENRSEDIEWLTQRVETLVQTPCTVPEAGQCLRDLGRRLGADEEHLSSLLLRIEAELLLAQSNRAGREQPLRVYYAIWRKPWMTVAANTFIGDVLSRLGADVVRPAGFGDADHAGSVRYPECSPDQAIAAGVDLVLLASEPWEFNDAQCAEIRAESLFGEARVELCDGRDFCWHGTRMAEGLGRARRLLQRS
ncbi:MAG: helical backbone metal receptor [Planctomycetota bacterium]